MSIQQAVDFVLRGEGGYKAASKTYGLPRSTIQRAVQAARGSSSSPAPTAPSSRAGARAPAREVVLEDDGWPCRYLLAPPSPTVLRHALADTAREVLAALPAGGRVTGMSGGQFSLIDLVMAGVEMYGPADVWLTTWRVGAADIEHLAWMLHEGSIKSLRFMVDRSETSRQMDVCTRVAELFGPDAVVLGRTHAKVVLLRGQRNIVIRASMNLNRNKRWEQFDVDDSAEILAHYQGFFEAVAQRMPHGYIWNESANGETYSELVRRAGVPPEAVERDRPAQPAAHVVDSEDDVFDVVNCTRIEFLEYYLRKCESKASLLEDAQNLRSAREWRALESRARADLDQARAEDREAQERRDAAEIRNPRELAARLLGQVPALCHLAPEVAREIWETMGRTLGRIESDDTYDDEVSGDEEP